MSGVFGAARDHHAIAPGLDQQVARVAAQVDEQHPREAVRERIAGDVTEEAGAIREQR